MTAPLVLGRYDWLKNRGGRGGNDAQRLAGLAKTRSSRAMRAAGNIRGVPQVVFKVVAGGGCKGPMGLAAQMDYILGKADQVIDPTKRFDRESRLHSGYSEALAKKWADRWKDRTANGHTMHMVASFPRGTDPEKIGEIMREACYEILDQGRSRFRYIAAVHTDKEHPHAHIIVDRKNADGEWFYFARNGEFTYDRFKDSIVEHAAAYGVELVNTSKLSRGITDDSETSVKRGLAGALIEHGAAPYQNDRRERMSYYVTVDTTNGQKTLWGKELKSVMLASGAVAGDTIRLMHEGKEEVQVTTRDGKKITTHRNRWAVELPGQEASRAGAAEAGPAIVPTEAEQRTAEWKRAQVLTHAAQYRSLAATYKGAFPALSSGFSSAAELLEDGSPLTPKALTDRREPMVTDADLQAEQNAARLTIERASDYLASVRETISEMDATRRPEVEARYFDAVRDVDELSSGAARAEYAEPAHGTLYAENQRHAIAVLDRDQLAEMVAGTGLDADELRARAEVPAPSAAVEEHWLEQDAQAVARARGYDMGTDEGRASAYGDLAEVHMAVYEAAEKRMEQDLDGADAEAWEMNRNEPFKSVPSLESVTSDPANSPSDREFWSGYQERMAMQHNDNRDLVSAVEDRQALINEAKDLAKRENPTVDEQRRLTEVVERVAGPDVAQQLREGKSDALAGVIHDRAGQFEVSEAFLKAEQAQGRDRADAIEAVQKDREAAELENQAGERREQERGDAVRARARERDNGHDL